MDKRCNLVFDNAVEQYSEDYIMEVNFKMKMYYNREPCISNYLELSEEVIGNEELMEELNKQWYKDKFFVGPCVVPGEAILKLEKQV